MWRMPKLKNKRIVALIFTVFILSNIVVFSYANDVPSEGAPVAAGNVTSTVVPLTELQIAEQFYRSPSTAFFVTQIRLIPFVTTFIPFGAGYSKIPGDMGWADYTGFGLSAASAASFLAGYFDPRNSAAWNLYGLSLFGLAYNFDLGYGAYLCANNTTTFIERLRKQKLNPQEKVVFYKDPIAAIGLNVFVSGGMANSYLNLQKESFIWYIADAAAVLGIGGIVLFNAVPSMGYDNPTMYVIEQAGGAYVVVYLIVKIVNSFNLYREADANNMRFYEQEIYKQQEFGLKNADSKDPLTAGIISITLGTVFPGAGNLYAGNGETFSACMGSTVLGGIIFGSGCLMGKDKNTSNNLKAVGIGFYVFSRLLDFYTSPVNAYLHDALYGQKAKYDMKAMIIPMIGQDSTGVTLAYSF